jgi:NAD+ kinase
MMQAHDLKLAFLASPTPRAQSALTEFTTEHGQYQPEDADVLIVLGGDGFMLHSLHSYRSLHKPFYGINFGSVGFLMNGHVNHELKYHIQNAIETVLYPLKMSAIDEEGRSHMAYAINEISVIRCSAMAAHLSIHVDGIQRLEKLVCDGILVATPAGSSAYNLSAHGPIIPLGTRLLALTPISSFRPRRWRGALLPDTAHITIKALDPKERPINVAVDSQSFNHIVTVDVVQSRSTHYRLLFNPGHNLEERILNEQFVT